MRSPSTTAPADPTKAGPRAAHAAVVLALFVGASALTRMVVMSADIVNHDEASYIVGSWELLHGRLPYTDFADNKPPLIYVYYAATHLLVSKFAGGLSSFRDASCSYVSRKRKDRCACVQSSLQWAAGGNS